MKKYRILRNADLASCSFGDLENLLGWSGLHHATQSQVHGKVSA